MKKVFLFLLICAILLLIPSCKQPHENEKSYSFELTLKQFKDLYQAAVEGEEAYDAKLLEVSPNSICTREQFLTIYERFKDQWVAVLISKRYEQHEIVFEYAGAEVELAEGTMEVTSIDMMHQSFARRTDACRAEGTFYSSSSPEPVYDKRIQEMIQSEKLVNPSDVGIFQTYFNEYRIRELYIYETVDYNLYYVHIYRADETYAGFFELKAYKEDGVLHNFGWSDYNHFSFMSLEDYVNE